MWYCDDHDTSVSWTDGQTTCRSSTVLGVASHNKNCVSKRLQPWMRDLFLSLLASDLMWLVVICCNLVDLDHSDDKVAASESVCKLPHALNPCFVSTYRKNSIQLTADDMEAAMQKQHISSVITVIACPHLFTNVTRNVDVASASVCPSVCLSVCPLHAGIVSKLFNPLTPTVAKWVQL